MEDLPEFFQTGTYGITTDGSYLVFFLKRSRLSVCYKCWSVDRVSYEDNSDIHHWNEMILISKEQGEALSSLWERK